MSGFYNSLVTKSGDCPPGCNACLEACSDVKGAGVGPQISIVDADADNMSGVVRCRQCSEPACADVCPTHAIKKNESSGVVWVDQERCVGCALCSLACHYGGIHYNADHGKASKCDHCDGDPKCVEACEHGVLQYIRSSNIRDCFVQEDILQRGTFACAGCGAEIAFRSAMRVLGKDLILYFAPGCATLLRNLPVTVYTSLFTNVAATMTGTKRYYDKIGRDVRLVAFIGDGCAADCSFQSLSGAAERGENLIIICYDNEAYMNTGNQRSGTTPQFSRTTTTPVGPTRQGKPQTSKYMPLVMLSMGTAYVATASISHLEDYLQKLHKAIQVKDGLAYLHVFTPCATGWLFPPHRTVDVARRAVETNYFPLWEAEHMRLRITHRVKKPKPVSAFVEDTGRFSHLGQEHIEALQETVDERMAFIEAIGDRIYGKSGKEGKS